jgi:acyl-CoA thioester hydrolase
MYGMPSAHPAAAPSTSPAQARQGSATPSESSLFQWPVRVYWEDTDAGGIVFYANYLKFFERARTEWLRSLGLGQQRLKDETGGMFVVTDAQLRYHRPARLDDELIVTACTLKAGRASLLIGQQALLKTEAAGVQSATLLCEGTIRIGWVEAARMQPARIPASILDSLITS